MNTNLALLLWLLFRDFYLIFSSEKYWKNSFWVLGTLMVAVSFVLHLLSLDKCVAKTPIQIQLFDWIQINNFNVDFGFLLDQLSILWLLFVTGIGSLIHLLDQLYA
jgi:NADH-quinone oxidoreductase subunit L